jgi:hypothetical protein
VALIVAPAAANNRYVSIAGPVSLRGRNRVAGETSEIHSVGGKWSGYGFFHRGKSSRPLATEKLRRGIQEPEQGRKVEYEVMH